MSAQRSALITGITGQDGGYLAERLVGEGTRVHGTTRPGERPPDHLADLDDGVTLHPLDLSDDESLRRVLREADPDEVYNLVGVSSVARSWSEPVMTAEVNGLFLARLLAQLSDERERGGKDVRLVQASSAEIFAGATTVPQDESTPVSPRSPYGSSKAFAHSLVQVFRARGQHASNAVLYNHESPRRPPAFVTRKITKAVAAIVAGHGTQLVLGNLEARRDWGWAPDYVDALVRAARHSEADDYVIATGVAHSVADFVATAFAHVGIDDWSAYVRVDEAFTRPTDAVELVGSARRARDVLGWSPVVGFEQLVGRMVDADLAPTRGEARA